MTNPRLWNFHTSFGPVGSTKAEMQFPHPLFLKGWKFIFALPTVVEINGGELVEIGGNTTHRSGV